MNPPEGLQMVLNEVRESLIQENKLYAQQIPEILPTTTIGEFAQPLLADSKLMNAFIPTLIQRVFYTYVDQLTYENHLRDLEGDEMPLGAIGQEIYVNPVHGREFNPNDFLGLLAKYPSDVKVQYNKVNWHHQYAQTVSYDNIRDAFTSWDSLYSLVDGQAQAMYNASYIDDFRMTKYLISNAYRNNATVMQTVTAVTNEQTAKALITQIRGLYLNFQYPSQAYNGWNLNGGYGEPITTWSNPSDIVLLIRNDVLAVTDVEVLARAFNLSYTDFMGRVYGVDNFDIYDEKGQKIFDGSPIIGAIADKRWFRIKTQMRRFDQFYNANNTSWNWYLRVEKMFNSSLFANMVMFVTQTPTVPVSALSYNNTQEITIEAGDSEGLDIIVTPSTATTPITYAITKAGAASEDITLVTSNNTRTVTLTAKSTASGEYLLTASADAATATMKVTVTAAAARTAKVTSK